MILGKLLMYIFIILQSFIAFLLIIVIFVQKGDDGGVGKLFLNNQIIYNRSDNILVRRLTVIFFSICLIGCYTMSVVCHYNKQLHITKQYSRVVQKYY